MKNFEKMAENVLKRRDEEIELRKHKRKNAGQIALSCTASAAAIAIIAGAVDWARYKRSGEGLFFGAGSNNGEYTQNLVAEIAPGEATTNRQDVPDDITFTETEEFYNIDYDTLNIDGVRVPESMTPDPEYFYPMTLEELNNKYNIDFEALNDKYSDWRIKRSSEPYGEYYDIGDDGETAWKKILYTQNQIGYADEETRQGICVTVRQDNFYVPAPFSAGYFTMYTSEEGGKYPPDWASRCSSVVAGWPAMFYKHTNGSLLADIALDYGTLRVYAERTSEEEFIEDVRAVLGGTELIYEAYPTKDRYQNNGQDVPDEKHEIPEDIEFREFEGWDPYLNAGFEPEDNLNIFYPMTLDELNEWYGINFEALNELLPEWNVHRAPYGEFHSDPGTPASENINWTQNSILYTREGEYNPI